jgi:hypothetical protein
VSGDLLPAEQSFSSGITIERRSEGTIKDCRKIKLTDLEVQIDREDKDEGYFIEENRLALRRNWQLDECYLTQSYPVSL